MEKREKKTHHWLSRYTGRETTQATAKVVVAVVVVVVVVETKAK